jgi:hypothetical protein
MGCVRNVAQDLFGPKRPREAGLTLAQAEQIVQANYRKYLGRAATSGEVSQQIAEANRRGETYSQWQKRIDTHFGGKAFVPPPQTVTIPVVAVPPTRQLEQQARAAEDKGPTGASADRTRGLIARRAPSGSLLT